MIVPESLQEKIESRLGDISSLPTLPSAVMQINELVNKDDVSMKQIESFMEMDPVLSSTALKMVNSSFYGMAQEISSLRLALVILGLKEIKNLVLSLSVFRLFSDRNLNGKFDIRHFWHHSATAGQIAKSLSSRLRLQFAGEEFVGGLIHDIGRVVLVKCLPEEYPELHREAHEQGIPLWKVEEEEFGFHHGHVGGWLGIRWKLPRKLVTTLVYHEHPGETPEYHQLVGVISLASTLSQMSLNGEQELFQEFHLEEHPALQLLLENTVGLESVNWENFVNQLGEEVRQSAEFVYLSQQNLWEEEVSETG